MTRGVGGTVSDLKGMIVVAWHAGSSTSQTAVISGFFCHKRFKNLWMRCQNNLPAIGDPVDDNCFWMRGVKGEWWASCKRKDLKKQAKKHVDFVSLDDRSTHQPYRQERTLKVQQLAEADPESKCDKNFWITNVVSKVDNMISSFVFTSIKFGLETVIGLNLRCA